MKTLSFQIREGKIEITGDTARGNLVTTDKLFYLDKAAVIDLSTALDRDEFLSLLLQKNHKYHYVLTDGRLNIDGIDYEFSKDGVITSKKTTYKFYIPLRDERNLFNVYKDFFSFHQKELGYCTMDGAIERLLDEMNIKKKIDHIDQGILGDTISIRNSSYHSSTYPDFELFLDNNNKLKFLHFLEPEGEYYSNGDTPISRQRLQEKLARANYMLELHDKMATYFDVQLGK
jgi:hypothetical protein